MKRYALGVILAAAGFGVTFGSIIAMYQLSRGGPVRLLSLLDLVTAFSILNAIVLTTLVGPVVLLIRKFKGGSIGPASAAIVGLLFAPVCLFMAWLIFRESDESVESLLSFWRRVPGEFVVNLIPNIVSVTLFSLWIRRPRLLAWPKPRA